MSEEQDSTIDPQALMLVRQRLETAEKSIAAAKKILANISDGDALSADLPSSINKRVEDLSISGGGKIIEGIFDGQNMIGPDKRQYPVPANYASKSKLVEGDILKLTVSDDGSFIYKQIGPVQRKRIQGKLVLEEAGKYIVEAGKKTYRVLLASVTYFKAENGDSVVLIIPEDEEGEWGAIENVMTAEQKAAADKRPADALSAFETSFVDI